MKKLFNFYLEDEVKDKVILKLTQEIGHTEKGVLASLIRVMLADFLLAEEVDKNLIKRVTDEYIYTQKKNKRSKM